MKTKTSIYHRTFAFAYVPLVAVLLWVAVSGFIQRFKCPSMTETELFLHIPKSVVCDWKHCN
jgi:hypothetical protein